MGKVFFLEEGLIPNAAEIKIENNGDVLVLTLADLSGAKVDRIKVNTSLFGQLDVFAVGFNELNEL